MRGAIRAFIFVASGCLLLDLGGASVVDYLLRGVFPGIYSGGGRLADPAPWVLVALITAFLAALAYGGLVVIQHYSLRLVMRFCRCSPFRLVRCLNYAVSLIFMQRAGGGFIFMHRFLLEHFARSHPEPSLAIRLHQDAT